MQLSSGAKDKYMQLNSGAKDSKYLLSLQIFNDEDYCGGYKANEMDELEKFLKGASISSVENIQTNKFYLNNNDYFIIP
ncbi:hypothetical protein TSAR_014783, partial [Trichomalopsis sarcophagae]